MDPFFLPDYFMCLYYIQKDLTDAITGRALPHVSFGSSQTLLKKFPKLLNLDVLQWELHPACSTLTESRECKHKLCAQEGKHYSVFWLFSSSIGASLMHL